MFSLHTARLSFQISVPDVAVLRKSVPQSFADEAAEIESPAIRCYTATPADFKLISKKIFLDFIL
jgi:hypothetical protein